MSNDIALLSGKKIKVSAIKNPVLKKVVEDKLEEDNPKETGEICDKEQEKWESQWWNNWNNWRNWNNWNQWGNGRW